jgi:hypothetical protein
MSNNCRSGFKYQYCLKDNFFECLITREKVSLRKINLEGNIHAQEINASQLPV